MFLAKQWFAMCLVFLIGFITHPSAACDAVPLATDSTYRSESTGALSRHTFVLEVHGPGLVSLDISTPAAAMPRLHLEAADATCTGFSPGGEAFVAENPRSWVFTVNEAGPVVFALASDDAELPLQAFKLRASFAAEPGAATEILIPAGDVPDQCGIGLEGGDSWLPPESQHSVFTNEVDPWEDDIVIGRRTAGGVISFESDGLPLHVTLWSGSRCNITTETARGALVGSGERIAGLAYAETFEVAIDSWSGSTGAYALSVRGYDLCGEGEVDDHGDTPLCATALKLGATLQGDLTNSFEDDEDFATFVLESSTTVAIDLAGDGGTNLTLLNAQGQRLGNWTPDASHHLTVTQALAAGRYFLAVTQVEVREVSWEVMVEGLSP